MQSTLIESAPNVLRERLAKSALEIARVDVAQLVGQCTGKLIAGGPHDIFDHFGNEYFPVLVATVPGVDERGPLDGLVISLLVERL